MPKVKPLVWSAEPETKTLRKNIKICMIKSGIDAPTLAKLLGVCKASAYNKINEPQKIQFEELCRIAYIFNVETAALLKEDGV